jgi:hypothetical protein
MNVLDSINGLVVLHPDDFWTKAGRLTCFCRKKSNGQMTKCGECFEWYHHKCTGLSEVQAKGMDDWKCGYCAGTPDKDGNCKWIYEIPKPKRGVAPVADVRNISRTPRLMSEDTDAAAELTSWADVIEYCRKSGKQLNLIMMKNRALAAKLVKEAGHHVGDEMSGGGLATRAVDDRLVDEFVGEGILDFDDEDADS